jgi:predicted GNAT family acetyltransferase
MEVGDNPEKSRYELVDGDEVVGEILYRRYPDRIVLVHTEVPAELEGKGLASRLVAGVLDDVRAQGLRVVPVCPFVRAYLRSHPEYAEVTD